jgi:hypothetical protein
MGIEEGEDVQAKGMCNIFNKIITEYFPNLEKYMPIQIQEALRNQTDQTKEETPHCILSLKQQTTETQERILKPVREKTYNIQR